jgi:hypothetical protein
VIARASRRGSARKTNSASGQGDSLLLSPTGARELPEWVELVVIVVSLGSAAPRTRREFASLDDECSRASLTAGQDGA